MGIFLIEFIVGSPRDTFVGEKLAVLDPAWEIAVKPFIFPAGASFVLTLEWSDALGCVLEEASIPKCSLADRVRHIDIAMGFIGLVLLFPGTEGRWIRRFQKNAKNIEIILP